MQQKLKALFSSFDDTHAPSERDLQLASAALLIEISQADHVRDEREQAAVAAALERIFQIEHSAIDELLQEAQQASTDAPSLYDFTRVINEHCNEEQKYALVRECWRVAFADGDLDKYEDHRLRKIADLIYLPHSLYIKAKLEVAGQS